MLGTRTNSGSHVWAEWHRRRKEAQETARSTDEFSDIEIEEADLDEFDGETGKNVLIDGRENPDTYTTDPGFGPRDAHDIRDDPRFD